MIGPFRPRFDSRIATYLNNSPTPAQRDCLESFFDRLAKGPVDYPNKKLGRTYFVAACDHVIRFDRDGQIVRSIELGIRV